MICGVEENLKATSVASLTSILVPNGVTRTQWVNTYSCIFLIDNLVMIHVDEEDPKAATAAIWHDIIKLN